MSISDSERPLRNGFTIIEMLVVIGIIAILAGITFGLVSGVTERGRTSRAQTELRTIAQALEQYRGHYGDYPWVGMPGIESNAEALFNALGGIVGPQGDEIQDDSGAVVGRIYVDFSRLTIGDSDNQPLDEEQMDSLPVSGDRSPGVFEFRFLDPWGNPYRYFYKHRDNPDHWNRRGFVLYSTGPSGEADSPDPNGTIPDSPENADNLYHDD